MGRRGETGGGGGVTCTISFFSVNRVELTTELEPVVQIADLTVCEAVIYVVLIVVWVGR